MKPKFKDSRAWEQAQILMQPALIRVIDNIRKELEHSSWTGTYQDIQNPFPGYQLCLTLNHHSITVNMWDLCFQICFIDYPLSLTNEQTIDNSQEVEIDTTLIDEIGEVDWHSLETKTQHIVKQVFANLPS